MGLPRKSAEENYLGVSEALKLAERFIDEYSSLHVEASREGVQVWVARSQISGRAPSLPPTDRGSDGVGGNYVRQRHRLEG
jgi:hypothetical protein